MSKEMTYSTYTIYFRYIAERFPDSTEDYHKEWYHRFLNGTAWNCSDTEGQAVLKNIVNDLIDHNYLESTILPQQF